MSHLLQFALPTPTSPAPISLSSGPELCLSPKEHEHLAQVIARILVLATSNPFAASLALSIVDAVLNFFDA